MAETKTTQKETKTSKIEITSMNIFQKMSAITEEINRVAKNLNVGTGQATYKAVGEADVLSAVKPIEIKYGVYSYPVNRNVLETNVLTTTTTKVFNGQETTTEKNQLFMRIETIYRFVNVEKPDEWVEVTTYGDGVDSQDKAPGKAMTYADKYALLKAYKIETGDDPDQNASETLKGVKSNAKRIPITEDQIKEIKELKVNEVNVLKKYGVESLNELTADQAEYVIKTKKAALEKMSKEASNNE